MEFRSFVAFLHSGFLPFNLDTLRSNDTRRTAAPVVVQLKNMWEENIYLKIFNFYVNLIFMYGITI